MPTCNCKNPQLRITAGKFMFGADSYVEIIQLSEKLFNFKKVEAGFLKYEGNITDKGEHTGPYKMHGWKEPTKTIFYSGNPKQLGDIYSVCDGQRKKIGWKRARAGNWEMEVSYGCRINSKWLYYHCINCAKNEWLSEYRLGKPCVK